jgi:hypothetical protein
LKAELFSVAQRPPRILQQFSRAETPLNKCSGTLITVTTL